MLSRVAYGQYVGTGANLYVDLIIPFKPKAVLVYSNYYFSGETFPYTVNELNADGYGSVVNHGYEDAAVSSVQAIAVNIHNSSYKWGAWATSDNSGFLYLDSAAVICSSLSYTPTGYNERYTATGYIARKMSYADATKICRLYTSEFQSFSRNSSASALQMQTTNVLANNVSGGTYYWIALG